MTAIVGVLCQDGAVIGADSSTTFTAGQFRTIEQVTEKLDVVSNRVIIAGTGQVGLGQRFRAVVETAWNGKCFQRTPIEVGKELCRLGTADFAVTQAKHGDYAAIVAFGDSGGRAHMCEFMPDGFQPELKTERIWYCSLGSSQVITDPFLAFIRDVFWTKGRPSVQDATFAVTWTLDHAIAVNPGGVNGPVKIATLERGPDGKMTARMLEEGDLTEHRQLISEAKTNLRDLTNRFRTPSAAAAADIPKPPTTQT